MIKKGIFIILTAIAINVAINSTIAFADTELLDQIVEQETIIQSTNNEIQDLKNEGNTLSKQIFETEKRIVINNIDREKKQKELNKSQEMAYIKINNIYQNSISLCLSYLKLLNSPENVGDFVSKYVSIKKDMKNDNDFMLFTKHNRLRLEVIEKTEEILYAERLNLKRVKSDLDADLYDLEYKKDEQVKLLGELNEEMTRELKREQDALTNTFIESVFIPQYLKGESKEEKTLDLTSNNIVRYATQFIGTPYIWGGTSPRGFDCSGLVKYVYDYYGITLPRVAADQQNVGFTVSLEDAKPGDLLFYGRPAHHVGIYVGDGLMLHAPYTGEVVKVSKVRDDLTNVQRILK